MGNTCRVSSKICLEQSVLHICTTCSELPSNIRNVVVCYFLCVNIDFEVEADVLAMDTSIFPGEIRTISLTEK